MLEELEIAQLSDMQTSNIRNEESSSEVKEDSENSQSNEIEEHDHSLGSKTKIHDNYS
jgi:hypothetical protein